MSDLRLWDDGEDLVIAESAEEAVEIMSGFDDEIPRWEEVPLDHEVMVLLEAEEGFPPPEGADPSPIEHGDNAWWKVTKTAAEWVGSEGRGHLCSRDF